MVIQDTTSAMGALVRRLTGREPDCIQALTSGGNNRVFRAEAGDEQWLLKEYFRHAGDTRDRLKAEYAFLTFSWSHGVRCVPRPLGCDAGNAIGLYEYVRGRPLTVEDIVPSAIESALLFWKEINAHRDTDDARALPDASESCFAIAQHLECLDRRVAALRSLEGSSRIQNEARDFVLTKLIPASSSIVSSATGRTTEMELTMDRSLALSERCISPSDFGFHNALIDESGTLRFFDFEYAGWDDPAKMVCDFFCQPAIPVPSHYLHGFLATVAATVDRPEDFIRRVRILMPVYRLKWCCIMLNDFLPVGGRRRSFAREGNSADAYKARQLQKARTALAQALEQR